MGVLFQTSLSLNNNKNSQEIPLVVCWITLTYDLHPGSAVRWCPSLLQCPWVVGESHCAWVHAHTRTCAETGGCPATVTCQIAVCNPEPQKGFVFLSCLFQLFNWWQMSSLRAISTSEYVCWAWKRVSSFWTLTKIWGQPAPPISDNSRVRSTRWPRIPFKLSIPGKAFLGWDYASKNSTNDFIK